MATANAAKKSPCRCGTFPKREKCLSYLLLVIALVWVGWNFQGYNRYELHTFQNAGMPAAYRLDTRTGEIKAFMNLYQFDTEPFNDVGDYTDWDLRQELDQQTTLLFEHSKLH
jgi:hypothetical protein